MRDKFRSKYSGIGNGFASAYSSSVVKIVFENDRFLAVDKPAGYLSIPSRAGKADLRPCLHQLLESQAGKKILPVHRLDVEVSGLVLFAKDAQAHRDANGWFESRSIKKSYEAWSEGAAPPTDEPQLWESLLVRGKRRTFESPHGKPSVTRAFWLRSRNLNGAQIQVWRLEPLTGRSHQLRVELAKRGNPIVGDKLYGAVSSFHGGAIALRAVKVSFENCAGALEYGLPQEIAVEGLSDV